MKIKGKTIFDFCKDAETRKEIIGGDYTESYYKGFPDSTKYEHLMKYAILTNNKDLFDSASSMYGVAKKDAAIIQNDAIKTERVKSILATSARVTGELGRSFPLEPPTTSMPTSVATCSLAQLGTAAASEKADRAAWG